MWLVFPPISFPVRIFLLGCVMHLFDVSELSNMQEPVLFLHVGYLVDHDQSKTYRVVLVP